MFCGFRRDGAVIAGCLDLQVRVWAHLCFGSVTVEMENHKACLSEGLNELSVFIPVSTLNCVCFSRPLLFYTQLRKASDKIGVPARIIEVLMYWEINYIYEYMYSR